MSRPRVAQALAAALACVLAALALPAAAAIVYVGASSGRNDGLPTNGTPGALTIVRPAGIAAGHALVASIAARPRSMAYTAPAGWVLMTATDQSAGGVTTAPGGMSLLTFYKIVTTSEPASYTWTFANASNQGGSAVGGILAFSGIDTSNGNPIDNAGSAWASRLTSSGRTHSTTTTTALSTNTMVVTSIAYLSAGAFGAPSGITGITERLDQSAPLAAQAIGTTLQMSTAARSSAGAVPAASAVATNDSDSGIGHIMVLKPSQIDPALAVTRNQALSPGGSATYTLTTSNAGVAAEPGPLTIVATLPAGLAYASASGSGWSCSVAGPVVTCTRSGTLAAGGSAPALTIGVDVLPAASGTVTFSATVSGTGGDGNTANNTASDSFAIPSPAYAYYALDEAAWGAIVDGSGNGRNASALGSAAPTGSGIGSPPGPALAGNPGTCGAASIPASTAATGINTGIDLNSLGNAGTIAFWYAANTGWNDGNARLLFDASNDLAGGDRHFFLVKDGAGILRFSLKDGAGTTSTAATTSYGYPAGEWHHVAVTWNAAASTLAIYLDGVLAASASTPLDGTLGNTATLYVGSQRMANVSGTPSGYTANSANGHIDELRLYSSALSALEIDSTVDFRHTCSSGIDHYELALPSSGLACLPATVTVTACTNASSPCTAKATTLAGQTATLATNAGTLAATSITFDATGVATTTLSHPTAATGSSATVTLSGEQTLAANARQCCPNGGSCSAASSCSIGIDSAGFIVAAAANGAATTVPAQTAGAASATYQLRAVKTNTTTKACEAALSGSTTVNWALQCQNPATCSAGNLMTLAGSSAVAIASNPATGVGSTTAVPMTFDANGNAPFGFTYADVGLVQLQASRIIDGATLATTTNAFVVKPAAFAVTQVRQSASPNTVNPAAASAAGGVFVKAGESFSATVTALTAAGTAAPNFGKESPAEGVLLTPALVAPAGGTLGALANATIAGTGFGNGAATVTNLAYGEVGIVTLTPSVADGSYLGAGAVSGTTTGNVGRFVPAKFALSAPAVQHRSSLACTPASSFSYLDETFRLVFTLTAQSVGGTTTANYAAAFAKLDPASAAAWNLAGRDGSTVFSTTSGRLSLGSAGGSFVNGVAANVTLTAAALRASTPDGPFNAAFGVAPVDSDGVALGVFDMASAAAGANDRASVGALGLRFGRLRLGSAIGAADRALALPAWVQHWNGSAWDTNTLDSCTTVAASAVNFGNLRRTLTTADTAASGPVTFTAGVGSLRLAAPAAGRSGSVDVALSLGSGATDASCLQPWTPGSGDAASAGALLGHLRGAWCGAGFANDPSARASFGLQRTQDHVIYRRENY